ncbi:hypothetical protein PsorP6_003138 [Peronosclerospora sorghi]|uniref:Uncharacterized protein n=1 Tax=Peronosclerospora sorghi TaxID=230839 RepID=A0ACC0VQC4_9STRA|nr:hypothetical protein PsorP6_003138 [Peronosclerospora sorghi]
MILLSSPLVTPEAFKRFFAAMAEAAQNGAAFQAKGSTVRQCSMQQGQTLVLELPHIPSETGTDVTKLSNLHWRSKQATELGASSLHGKSSESMGASSRRAVAFPS